jgi:hypothetical protein
MAFFKETAALRYRPCVRPYRIDSKGQKMQTPLNSIYGVAGSALAVIPGWLWHLSQRRIRMASTSEERSISSKSGTANSKRLTFNKTRRSCPSAARLFTRCVFQAIERSRKAKDNEHHAVDLYYWRREPV